LGNLDRSVGLVRCRVVLVVVADDGNLAGQLRNGDRVAVTAPAAPPTGDRRGPNGSILGQ
jgi:hypothetical protein